MGRHRHVRDRVRRLRQAARAVVAISGVGAALALIAPSAGAALVYNTRGLLLGGRAGVCSARDDNTSARRLARGAAPSVSPNGRLVAYWPPARTDIRPAVVPAAGGASRVLLHNWNDPATVGWSPNSRTIAAATARWARGAPGHRRRALRQAPAHDRVRIRLRGRSVLPRGPRVIYTRVQDARANPDIYTSR